MSSKDIHRQQTIPKGSYPNEISVKPGYNLEAPSMSTAQIKTDSCEEMCRLLEEILERGNLLKALKRVEKNKGSAGIDGMETSELRSYLKDEWQQIKSMILEGSYTPQPVRRVEIAKPEGGIRLLGIPTVLDRMIQQAITQVLMRIFEPTFSNHSHGFRPGRKAHDAIRRAKKHIEDGYRYVVDIDLEKYFDRVNHDKLMYKLSVKIKDKRVLKLIRKYLESGIMINGVVMGTQEGVPQGGNLSPLLSNIMLDDLDKTLEARGHRFERYADDCNIYVKNMKAGERVLKSIRKFLYRRLKLKINEEKSGVDKVDNRRFLGFSFYPKGDKTFIRLAPRTIKRLKNKIRDIFDKGRGQSVQKIIGKINEYLLGWIGYFQIASMYWILKDIDGWIRRHLRAVLWNQWKRPRTRYKKLTQLGVDKHNVVPVIRSGKGTWRMSSTPPVHQALGTEYFEKLNLICLVEKHAQLRQNCSTAVYGPVRTVV